MSERYELGQICQRKSDFAVVLLAAGSSMRMGRSKQLLPVQGTSLLKARAKLALELNAAAVIVVLGPEAEKMKAELSGLSVEAVFNPDHRLGQGSSLRAGILRAKALGVSGVLILLVDQPLIGKGDLQKLLPQSGASIRAAAYADSFGAPAYFPSRFFNELLGLPPHLGAKAILQKYAGEVERIEMPGASLDLDTWAEYQEFLCRA